MMSSPPKEVFLEKFGILISMRNNERGYNACYAYALSGASFSILKLSCSIWETKTSNALHCVVIDFY